MGAAGVRGGPAVDPDASRDLGRRWRNDPLDMARTLWPNVYFYDKQQEIIASVRDNDETIVPAGNMLGKDFVAGFICLWFFLTRSPCRIITTSAKEDHLRVLWGEINRFIQTCKIALDVKSGGPLLVHHQDLRKIINGQRCPLSYCSGLVASDTSLAAMQGHHVAKTGDGVPRTLFVADESSSVPDEYHKLASTWMNRALIIGNTWPCENFFFRGVEEGDLERPPVRGSAETRYYRRVIRVTAEDSPNVRLGLYQQRRGEEPTGEILVPGVKDWEEYQKNLATWDDHQKCVSLWAQFYKGAEIMLFPSEWLDAAAEAHAALVYSAKKAWTKLTPERVRVGARKAEAIGVDTGGGSAKSAYCAVDRYGIIELMTRVTKDTSRNVDHILEFAQKHGLADNYEQVLLDAGGGGKEHADRLRRMGHMVRTVGFGESVLPPVEEIYPGWRPLDSKVADNEQKYAYRNRRCQMYGQVRALLDPALSPVPFAIPGEYTELRRQLSKFPLIRDSEGKLDLPPKNRRPGSVRSKEKSLVELIGHSPDEADSFVLAVHGMLHPKIKFVAGPLADEHLDDLDFEYEPRGFWDE